MKSKSAFRLVRTGSTTAGLLAAALAALFATHSAQATAITWNLATGGNWNTADPNWAGDATTFTDDGSVAVTFDNTAGGAIAIAANMSPLSTTVSAASGTYTFSGGPIDTGTLIKSNGGTLTLSAANTFSGVTLNGGTLNLTHNNAIGANTLTINGGTVSVNNNFTFPNNPFNINGDCTFFVPSASNIYFGTGPITLGNHATVTLQLGQSPNLANAINNNGYTLSLINTQDGGTTISGKISGAGGLTLRNDLTANLKTLTVNNATSDFTGPTTLQSSTAANLAIVTSNLSNAGVAGSLGMATAGPGAVIQANNNVVWQPVGTTDRGLNLASNGAGTVTISPNGNAAIGSNNTYGGITATGTGAKTLFVNLPWNNNTTLTINGAISNGTDGSPLTLNFGPGLTDGGNFATLHLKGVNTFTGPINYQPPTGTPNKFSSALNITGAGQLGAGTYSNTISMGTTPWAIFNYGSSATQTLSGVISGAGKLQMSGGGSLTLSNANTYTGLTELTAGTLVLGNNLALQNSALSIGAAGNITLSGVTTPTIGGLVGSRALATVISSGYTGVTSLTLNPQSSVSAIYSGAIGDNGSTMALIKSGAGTQILSGSNLYTGTTTINAGTLQLGEGTTGKNGSVASTSIVDHAVLVFNNADTQAYSGNISGTGMLIKSGAGKLTLSGTNSYNGGTYVTAGTLQYDATSAIAGTGRNVTIYSPGALAFGSSFVDTNIPTALARVAAASTGAIAADNYGSTDLNFNTAGLTAASLGAVGSVTYSGTLTPNGTTYRLGGGGGTLTFTPAAYTSGNDLVINGNGLTGTVDFGGLTKTFGAITVAGGTVQNGTLNCSSYSLLGGTVTATLNNGSGSSALTKTGSGTSTFNGTTAQTFTGGLIVNAGTVAENFANFTASPNNNLIDPTNVLTLGGGTLSLTGKNNVASLQTFASTTLSANSSSTITLAKTGTGTMTVDLKGINRTAGNGSVLRFSAIPDTTNLIANTTNANINDILGPWAVVGATTTLQYATVDSGKIVNYTGATPTTSATDLSNMTVASNPNAATTNYSWAKAGGLTPALNLVGHTLRVTSTADADLVTTGGSLKLNGLIGVGTNRTVISGAGNLVIGDTRELVIHWTVGFSAITCPVVDNPAGDSSVVINIPQNGEFNFSGTNTYKGGTTINAVEQLNFNANSFGSGPVTVNGGVRFRHLGGTLANALTLNGTILHSGGTYSGPITLATTSSAAGTAGTISGDMSGPGGFTVSVNAGNVQTFSGTNTYTGATSITSGMAMFAKAASLYNAVAANWTPANISVNSGAALRLAVGGTNEFTGAQVGTLVSNLTTGVNNNGLKAGSTLYLDPRNAGGTPVTVAANITDSTGSGGGQVNLTIGQTDGSNPNQTVVLSGANTYSGKTTLDRYKNTTLSVSSFNSVSSPVASSSLGRPTTVADGTINFGNGNDTSTGVLLYTGTGEITDRVLNSVSNTGHITLDQSGSNLLKFTGGITGGNSSRILTLQGSSTTGSGEIAGAITQGSVTKTGTGTWTLSGANSFTGTTSISNGTLKLGAGSLANTAIAVTGTGILAVQPGSATAISAGNSATATAGATLNLGARTFDMTDGFVSAFNLVQASTFAGSALTVTSGATFRMNLGAAGADLLAVTKAAAVGGTVNVTIDTTGAGSLTPGTYNLITAASGLGGGTWQFTGGGTTKEVTIGASTYELTLAAGATAVSVTVTGSGTPYDTWANGTFVPPLTLKGTNDNQDGDSLTNLQEFAFGTQPTVTTGKIVVSGASVTPGVPEVVPVGGDYYLVFGRRKDYVAAGLTYTVEFTAGLDLWGDNNDIANPPEAMGATDGTIDAMRVKFPPTIHVASGDPKPTFARVRVVMAP